MALLRSLPSILLVALSVNFFLAYGRTSGIFKCPCSFRVSRTIDPSGVSNVDPFDVLVRPASGEVRLAIDSHHSVRNIKLDSASHSDAFMHHFDRIHVNQRGLFHVSILHKANSGAHAPSYSLEKIASSRQSTCPVLIPFDLPPSVAPISRQATSSGGGYDLASKELPAGNGNGSAGTNIVGGLLTNKNIRRYIVSLSTAVPCRDGSSGCATFCSGTLIAPNWIVTAAHCTLNVGVTRVFVNTDRGGTGAFSNIIEAHRHPKYDASNFNASTHDIAVAKLAKDVVKACSESSVCNGIPAVMKVNFRGSMPKEEQYVRTAGYGRTRSGETGSDRLLRQVDAPVADFDYCRASYLRLRTPVLLQKKFQICAGYRSGYCDSCQGDSGGPVLGYLTGGEPVLVGVTSIGVGCGFLPGAAVRVTGQKKWLRKFVPVKGSKADIPNVGPICERGEFLSLEPAGLAKCRDCPIMTSSIPPTRTCSACPNNLRQDTVDKGTCSCRRYDGRGEAGTGTSRECKRCPSGKTSPIGSNVCA